MVPYHGVRRGTLDHLDCPCSALVVVPSCHVVACKSRNWLPSLLHRQTTDPWLLGHLRRMCLPTQHPLPHHSCLTHPADLRSFPIALDRCPLRQTSLLLGHILAVVASSFPQDDHLQRSLKRMKMPERPSSKLTSFFAYSRSQITIF